MSTIKDILNLINDEIENNGYSILLDNFNPSEGVYFKIDKNGDISSFLNKGREKDKSTGEYINNFELIDEYDFFKRRMFYEGQLNANKCIDSSAKKIHSVTPYCLILKKSTIEEYDFSNPNISSEDELIIILRKHFSILKNNYNADIEVDETVLYFLKYLSAVSKEIKDKKSETKIIIMRDVDVDLYKQAFLRYLDEKSFVTNNSIIELDGITYGTPIYNLSLNAKKPHLSKSIYNEYPYKVSLEEAKRLALLSKINSTALNNILNNLSDNNIKIDMVRNSSSKAMEITGYDFNLNNKLKYQLFNEVSLISTNFENNLINEVQKERLEVFDLMNGIFRIDSKNYIIRNMVQVRNEDFVKTASKSSSMAIAQSVFNSKKVLQSYFYENNNLSIQSNLEKILFRIFIENLKHNESKQKLRVMLDTMISILDYVNCNDKYLNISNDIYEIWINLLNLDFSKLNQYQISSDKEFFFIIGQFINWLNSFSESSINQFNIEPSNIKPKQIYKIKNKIKNMYKQYYYKIKEYPNKLLHAIYNAIISYEIKETQVKDEFTYKYIYYAGYLGDNIRFKKLKKEKTEELENEK